MGRFVVGFLLGFVVAMSYPRDRAEIEERLEPLQARGRQMLDESLSALQQARSELAELLRRRREAGEA